MKCETEAPAFPKQERLSLVSILPFLLAFSLFPASLAYSNETDDVSGWAKDIPTMLEEGEYAEGEVIACIEDTSALSCSNDNTEVETLFDLNVEAGNGDGLVVIRSEFYPRKSFSII